MNIVKIPIGLLNNAEYNPRKDLKPEDAEYIKLKKSIETFGYVDPVIVNKNGNIVVGGHQRLKVLKDLGYEEIDVVYVELDKNNEKALNVALNKISGDWDAEKLEDILRDLTLDEDFDIELTGFSLDEVDKLFGFTDEELTKGLAEFQRDLTEEEVNKRDAIYIKIGKNIKIEITGDDYELIKSLTPVEIVNRLTGGEQ